jgi:general secretion pathway protein G
MRRDRRVPWRVCALVAVALAVLAALFVIPPQVERGKMKKARADLEVLRVALELFHDQNGRYPTTDEGLAELVRRDDRAPCGSEWDIPPDPWGTEYEYESDGTSYHLVCFGADACPGGSGWDADISLNEDARPAVDTSE